MVHSTVFPVWFNTSIFHSQNQLDIKNVANLSYSLITVSSGLSGSYDTIYMTAIYLKGMYPDRNIEVIDSLSASLASGFLCMDARRCLLYPGLHGRKQSGLSLLHSRLKQETCIC